LGLEKSRKRSLPTRNNDMGRDLENMERFPFENSFRLNVLFPLLTFLSKEDFSWKGFNEA